MSSTRLHASPLAASCLTAALLVAPAALAQSPLVGWTTAHRVTTDSGNGQPPAVTVMRTLRAGTLTRIEMFEGGDATDPRAIMITDSAAGTLLSVMPAQQSAVLIAYSPATMRPMLEAVRMQPVGKPESRTDDLGDGPAILGHPTHHYRTTGRSVMHYAGPTVSCDRTTETRTDVWTTRDSIGPREPHRARQAPAVMAPGEGSAAAVPTLDTTAMRFQAGARSHLLRTETASTLVRDGVPPQSVKVTDEVTELRYGPLDSALFSAPAGYRVTDRRAMMAGIDQKKMYEAMAPMFERIFCGSGAAK
ncbi:MAG: hypothetical protein JWN79_3158 [Gemmatimonadetes bacterium]|nr:hypothetical protein [Gemmatimonadota bacterium]